MIKKIYQELRAMAKKKFISSEVFDILTKMPENKLKNICAALMYNIVFLDEVDAKRLLKVRKKSDFQKLLLEIKTKIESNDVDNQIKQLQYVLCKIVGLLELKKDNEELQDEIYDIILTEILYPLSDWLKEKSIDDKNAKICFNILKNEIFDCLN